MQVAKRFMSSYANAPKGISIQVYKNDTDAAFRSLRRRAKEEGRDSWYYLPHIRHVKTSVEKRKEHKAQVRRTENKQLRMIIIRSLFFEKNGYDLKDRKVMDVINAKP